MAKIESVAYYILDKLGPMGKGPLKRILYYGYVSSLVNNYTPLFASQAEVSSGRAYVLYKEIDAVKGIIPKYSFDFEEDIVDKSMFKSFEDYELDLKEKEAIDYILDRYPTSITDLFKINETPINGFLMQEPCAVARRKLDHHIPGRAKVTNEMILSYYSAL